MKKFADKKISILIITVVTLCCSVMYCLSINDAEAASDSLSVKVGFYGGPYYEIKNYSYYDMCRLSDGNVWTYSGLDSGSFMRICYAWGVQLADLVNDAGVDVDSVNYFHMGTSDSYGERYATFSASTLFGERYFYPNMVTLADASGSNQQQLDFSRVDSDVTADAEAVPALLAIGSTEFSREEAVDVMRRFTESDGEEGYSTPSAEDLPEDHRYRLLFGQEGLGSLSAAQNVRESDKYICEINLQLAGAPELKVKKALTKGEKNKIGSKYNVSVTAELPVDYSYISDDVLNKLEKRILKKISAEYDDSVVKLTKKGSGSYEMEIVGEGSTDLTFSYARKEYDGTTTAATGSTSISGEEQDTDTDNDNDSENEKSLTPANKGKTAGLKGASGKKSVSKTSGKTKGIKKTGKKNKKSDSSEGTWQSTELDNNSSIETDQSEDDDTGALAGGALIMLIGGAAGTVIRFFRNI